MTTAIIPVETGVTLRYKSTLNMSQEEWLEERRKGIGGSDVAAILGVSKYKTPVQVYYEKIGEADTQEDNRRMEAGRRLEKVIAKWWSDESGRKIQEDNKIRYHAEYPVLFANIDRLILSSPGHGPEVLECKNTNRFVFQQWVDDGLPIEYYWQVQHYMNVTGYDNAVVVVLVDGWDLQIIEVIRDDEAIELATERLLDFWFNNVMARKVPEPIQGTDIDLIFKRVSNEKVLDVTGNSTLIQVCRDLAAVKRQIKPLEEKEKRLTEEIKLVMKDSALLFADGEKLVSWKQAEDSIVFDEKQFQIDDPGLYEKYLYPKRGSRRFLVSKEKKGGE